MTAKEIEKAIAERQARLKEEEERLRKSLQEVRAERARLDKMALAVWGEK